jgi:hypothetical protein
LLGFAAQAADQDGGRQQSSARSVIFQVTGAVPEPAAIVREMCLEMIAREGDGQ